MAARSQSSRSYRNGPFLRLVRSQILKWSCAGLVVFHAILLLRRIGDSSIFDPVILAKWLGAAALMAAFFAFQRRAPMRLRGHRPLIVFWLLVVLLHAGAPAAGDPGELATEMASVVELGLIVPAAIAIGYLLRRSGDQSVVVWKRSVTRPTVHLPIRSWHLFAPRSPPLV